ncbi:MFS transporter [Desulfolithobacter sp.]
MKTGFLPRTVIIFGLVSFLNDTASEMITPLLPLFLTATLGAGPAVVGLVEGVAEATASLLKLYSGRMADRGWNHKRLVLGGYSISNIARPLIGLALGWAWVLVLRFLDRVGKGLRTSPRDALIAGSIDAARRGRAFGFHRALDNGGSMLGPLCAWLLLRGGMSMQHVFFWSLVPGIFVIALLYFGLEDSPAANRSVQLPPLRWSVLDNDLRGVILAAGGLALASVPEAFLVLWASDQGLHISWVPLLWAGASAVKAVVAGPAGCLSDCFGRLEVLLVGWSLRIVLLLALAWSSGQSGPMIVWVLFLGYAAALASTEGAERALVGDFAPSRERATAFGLYHMVVGLAALPGALLFGTVWQIFGSAQAFLLDAVIAAGSVVLLVAVQKE